jgi:hypothetical protein
VRDPTTTLRTYSYVVPTAGVHQVLVLAGLWGLWMMAAGDDCETQCQEMARSEGIIDEACRQQSSNF